MPEPPSPAAAQRLRRLAGNPILHRDATPGVGRNINGPSLIAAPPWLDRPLGRYYLYFAHHRGTYIRLATADDLEGPWSVYQPGTLQLAQSHFPVGGRRPHIASPDVHVDPATQTVRMYYHGLDTATRVQHTRVATSGDGLHFEARPELLGRPYFRVFTHAGRWYALGMPGILYRSADGLSGFERGPRLFDRDMRHCALLVRGDELLVFWSRVGDTPERILCSRIPLHGDWLTWRPGPPSDVIEPEYPWEGADQPLEPSVRGWSDEPVRQLRDPAIFREDDRTYLLYSVAGESGLAIAELDLAAIDAEAACPEPADTSPESAQPTGEPAPGTRPRRFPARVREHLTDPGLERTRQASVTIAAALASFGTALLIEHAAHLSTSVLVLAVALSLSMGRVTSRPGRQPTGWSRVLAVIVLPLVAVGANEIGAWMVQHPNVGDALWALAVSATIYLRRFGPLAQRLATVATLPLIAMLVVPAPIVTTPGSSGDQRWWSAVIALVAMAWVTATQLIGTRTGLLPPPPRQRPAAPPPAPKGRGADWPRGGVGGSSPRASTEEREAPGDERRGKDARPAPRRRKTDTAQNKHAMRVLASTRMAIQMGAALGAAFAVGRDLFPGHWTWVVLTAFIVCSGNRGRGDVVHKAVMRLLGASVGTLAATALTGALPVGNRWSVVAVFAVLTVALWLRPLNYGYWAAGMTAALGLLYGYYGERGPGLLGDRLEAIVVGGALGVAASWFLMPVRTNDVIRRDTARALAALAEYLDAVDSEPASLADHQERFTEAVTALDRLPGTLRLVPPRWRTGPAAYVPALRALHRCGAALPKLTRLVSGAEPGPPVPGAGALTALHADILELRRGIGRRVPPDPDAWSGLAETVAQLPAALYQPALSSPAGRETQAPAIAPRDRLWSSTERVLGYVNRVHGTGYCLSTRLGGAGSSSIYLLDEPGGDHAVLKWNRDPATAAQRRAEPLIAAARRGGWPAPAWLASGTTPSGFPYQVQEHAPGTPSGRVTAELVRAVLPVLDVQAGLAPDAGHDWSASDRRIVFGAEPAAADPVPADTASSPGSGDTALSPAACSAADTDDASFSPDTDDASPAGVVAAFSPGGAAFVESVRAWVSPFRSVTLAGGDLVHGNLVPANVLLDGGRLTALTGAEGAGKGSRMHDVASLAVPALLWDGEPGALDDLLGYGASHARPGELEISLAARLLGVVARHVTHDPDNAGDLIGQAAAGLARLGHADAAELISG